MSDGGSLTGVLRSGYCLPLLVLFVSLVSLHSPGLSGVGGAIVCLWPVY